MSESFQPSDSGPDIAPFEPYQTLLADLGRLARGFDALHGDHLTCRKGCSGCCHQHLGVFAVEADALSAALRALPPELRAQQRAQAEAVLDGRREACPLLIDEACSVYEARPVICRTHGYPLHYEAEAEDGETEILLDVCPLNFTAEGALESLSLEQTLPLDRLNLRLAAINHVYCRDHHPLRAGARVPLAELILDQP